MQVRRLELLGRSVRLLVRRDWFQFSHQHTGRPCVGHVCQSQMYLISVHSTVVTTVFRILNARINNCVFRAL